MAVHCDSDYTLSYPAVPLQRHAAPLLALTIAWHAQRERAGEQFFAPHDGSTIALSRFAPLFTRPGGEQHPLGERCVARDAMLMQATGDGGLRIRVPVSRMRVQLDGALVESEAIIGADALRAGVLLRLGGGVLLCINRRTVLPAAPKIASLIGVSEPIELARRALCRAAGTDFPVLLRGETGTGKELAARAIHDLGSRAAMPYIAVNMAGISETLAAAELFGAAKGAFTGADHSRQGYFGEAANGTLFLDEIGDTPAEVQPMLLRVLENGEYHSLGSPRQFKSLARLIAATDRELGKDRFNQPLLWRLETLVVDMPPLRQRRDDIGMLVAHFTRRWEVRNGAAAQLPIELVAEMCAYDWPGNVRQLVNIVQRALLAPTETGPGLAELLGHAARQVAPPESGVAKRSARGKTKLEDISAEAVLGAMEQGGWSVRAGAQSLGISRPSMYKLLETHPQIRSAAAIPPEQLKEALREHHYDILHCASVLKTPIEALRRCAVVHGLLEPKRTVGRAGTHS